MNHKANYQNELYHRADVTKAGEDGARCCLMQKKPVYPAPKTKYLPTLCGLMRQNTISTVTNTPINYSATGDFITSKLTEVTIDNSMLHNSFRCSNIAVYIKHIKMR